MASESKVKFNLENNEQETAEYLTESEESDHENLNRQFNKFELLDFDQTADVLDGDHDDEDENIDEIQSEEEAEIASRPPATTSKSSKQKRRRNKSKHNKKDVLEDFDASLMNDKPFSPNDPQSSAINNDRSSSSKNLRHLMLKITLKNLLPETEVIRMFGKSVLQEEESRNRRQRGRLPGSSGIQRSKFVSNVGFEINAIGSGPKMELDDLFNQQIKGADGQKMTSKRKGKNSRSGIDQNIHAGDTDGPLYFKFVHDSSYQLAHSKFLDAVVSGHTERVAESSNPFHVESLIQLSDMVKVTEDYKFASELLERVLLIFERGFHPRFNIAQPTCRLSYKRPENRSFFITIFKHISYCNRRGLRRTPFEYSKLLLSLDPENDPLFATLLIDFYALRSEEYDYLIEFITKWDHLSRLPNMNFSLALAHFMKSKLTKRGKEECDLSLKTANQCLQTALLRYPNFIVPLLDALSGEPNSELKKCEYFDYSVYGHKYKLVPESVDLLISLYVQRTSCLWKTKPVLSWLENNIADLVGKFASKELTDVKQYVDYWSTFRSPIPRNLLRHIVLSDLKVNIPPTANNSAILDIDPYPPEDSIASYQTKSSNHQVTAQDSSSSSYISSLFLRSIVPNFNAEEWLSNRQQRSSSDQTVDSSGNTSVRANNEHGNDGSMANGINRMEAYIHDVLSSLSDLLLGTEVPNNDSENNGNTDNPTDRDNNDRQR